MARKVRVPRKARIVKRMGKFAVYAGDVLLGVFDKAKNAVKLVRMTGQ